MAVGTCYQQTFGASCTIKQLNKKSGLRDWKRSIYSNRAIKYSNITVIYL